MLDRCFLFVLLSGCGLLLGLFLRRQPRDGITNQASLVHEVSRNDGVSRWMAIEPALPMTKQLLDFVVADPVVFLVVENRNEHVQVREQVAQPPGRPQCDREQPARTERPHALVEFMTSRLDCIPERLEQRAEERFASAAGNGRESRLERQFRGSEIGFPLASTTQSRVEPTRKDDREQRRCDVRPVVDVLVLSAAFATAAPDHSDWIDVEENCRRAGFFARLRIEDGRVAEREFPRVDILRVLVQQEPQIRSRPVSCSNR